MGSQEKEEGKPELRQEEIDEIIVIISTIIHENSGGLKMMKFIVEALKTKIRDYYQGDLESWLLAFIKSHHPELCTLEYTADLGGGHLRLKMFIYKK